MYQAVIFDLDGTLIDSYPGILDSLNYALTSLGRSPVDLVAVKKMVGKGLDHLISHAIGVEKLEEGKRLFRDRYDQAHLSGTFLLPDAVQTLSALQSKGIRMSVASNKPSDYTRKILEHLNLQKFFTASFGPEQVKKTKPDPAMLQELMKRMNVEPAEVLYVGDMIMDIQTARNAGVAVAVIPSGGNSRDELASASPDYLLDDLEQLLSLFKK
jgi:2-phosphoglycolate phosphatase